MNSGSQPLGVEVQHGLVSVIIPVYNTADYLRSAVESVLSQTHSALEVIAVDDGSTDGSLSILRELVESDSRIRVISQSNAGPSGARNTGMSAARGEYVFFVDSDDHLIREDALQLFVLEGYAAQADLVVSRQYYPRQEYIDLRVDDTLCGAQALGLALSTATFFGSACNILYRRSLLVSHHIRFSEDIMVGEDQEFVIRSLIAASRVGLVHEHTYEYAKRDDSIMHDESQGSHAARVLSMWRLAVKIDDLAESVGDEPLALLLRGFARDHVFMGVHVWAANIVGAEMQGMLYGALASVEGVVLASDEAQAPVKTRVRMALWRALGARVYVRANRYYFRLRQYARTPRGQRGASS